MNLRHFSHVLSVCTIAGLRYELNLLQSKTVKLSKNLSFFTAKGHPLMFTRKSLLGRFVSAVALTGCLFTGLAVQTWAQNNPGLTIFSGVQRENILRYYFDFGGRAAAWDRLRLRIPSKKMELAVQQFVVRYPDYYTGKFNPDRIEVRVDGESLPIAEVDWDKDNYQIQIYMQEPVPAQEKVEIVLSDVKNPRFGGTFYFECLVWTPGDVPLPRYLGTWILTIS